MTKITGLIIMVIAAVIAIFCILFGIKVMPDLKNKNSVKTRLLIAVSIMIAFFTGCFSSDNGNQKDPVPIVTQEPEAKEINDPEKACEELREDWQELKKVDFSVFYYEDTKEEEADKIKELDREINSSLKGLEKSGFISSLEYDAVTFIYEKRFGSLVERAEAVDLPASTEEEVIMCYAAGPPVPTSLPEWDYKFLTSKELVEKKLLLLEEIYGSGNIDGETFKKAKSDMEKRLSLLAKCDEYWKDSGGCESHNGEVGILLELYENNTAGIKDGKEVDTELIKASEFIWGLERK